MYRTFRPPQRIYAATVILWALGMATHCAWFIWSALSGPPSPDLYANHLSFMLVVFLLFRAPLWLIGLLLILVGEFAMFGRKHTIPDEGRTCD